MAYGRGYRGRRRLLPGPILVVLAVLAVAAAMAFLGVIPVAPLFRSPQAEPEEAVSTLAPVELEAESEPEAVLPQAPQVRGIYISGPTAGSARMEELIALVEETELNAMVIDVKNDEGKLTWTPASGAAVELGAGTNYIQDLPALVTRLKERGIYTIARIVSFKDPLLAQAKPELALRYTDGSAISEGAGPAWVNPYEEEVWDYLTEIALEAAGAGFDEVQLGYVRFPTVQDIESVDFGPAAQETGREKLIANFLKRLCQTLHRQGVWLSADVFGTVIGSELDGGLIGQDYSAMAREADFICPMVYPSHYARGAFQLEVPDRQPYETVYAAMKRSQAVLSGLDDEDRAVVRAWLQGFTATWVRGHITYGAQQLREQIQAVYDAGYTDWIIWNANNTYSAQGLLAAGE